MARRRIGVRRGGGRFRLTSGVIAAAVLVIGAVIVLLQPGARQAAQGVQAADDDVIAAGGRAGGGAFAFFGDTFRRVQDAWSATDKIEALERENAELRDWKELALALSERQQRYEKLLNMPPDEFGQTRRDDQTVSARLILDVGGPFRRTLLANAGSDHGVKVGYVAMNENGLIGRVISVGRRSARVLLLDDYNSRVPVMGEQSRARAILVGQAGQNARLDEGPLRLNDPKLDYVVGQGGFLRGERLVTSGDGGIYPRGVLVGEAVQDNSGWAARLGAARQPIDYIRLIPYFAPEPAPNAPASEQSLPRPPQALYSGVAPAAAPAPAEARPRPPTVILPPTADEETTPRQPD